MVVAPTAEKRAGINRQSHPPQKEVGSDHGKAYKRKADEQKTSALRKGTRRRGVLAKAATPGTWSIVTQFSEYQDQDLGRKGIRGKRK